MNGLMDNAIAEAGRRGEVTVTEVVPATPDRLEAFRVRLERDLLAALVRDNVDCEANRAHCKASVTVGKKYARVDAGGSGKYMVVLATSEIFGIKGYGVIHMGHRYGTLDTVEQWNWMNYTAVRS